MSDYGDNDRDDEYYSDNDYNNPDEDNPDDNVDFEQEDDEDEWKRDDNNKQVYEGEIDYDEEYIFLDDHADFEEKEHHLDMEQKPTTSLSWADKFLTDKNIFYETPDISVDDAKTKKIFFEQIQSISRFCKDQHVFLITTFTKDSPFIKPLLGNKNIVFLNLLSDSVAIEEYKKIIKIKDSKIVFLTHITDELYHLYKIIEGSEALLKRVVHLFN